MDLRDKLSTRRLMGGIAVAGLAAWLGAGWFFSGMIVNAGGGRSGGGRRGQASSTALPAAYRQEMVTIPVAEGITLQGELYRHRDSQQRAVIFSPGRGGGFRHGRRFLPLLAEYGCDVLLLQHRGFGESTPAPLTYGFYEKNDLAQAVDWLTEQVDTGPRQLGLIGISYGSAISLQALDVRDDLAFVIADSTYPDLRTVVHHQASQMFGNWIQAFTPVALMMAEWRGNFSMEEVSPRQSVIDKQTPILLMHSLDDRRGSSAFSELVYDNCNHEHTVLSLNDWGNGHGGDIRSLAQYRDVVHAFFAAHVPAFVAVPSADVSTVSEN